MPRVFTHPLCFNGCPKALPTYKLLARSLTYLPDIIYSTEITHNYLQTLHNIFYLF